MSDVAGQFTFFGSGASMGVPVIGCKCSVCTSSSPFNRRLRSTSLLVAGGKKILVDCGPDFRQQALFHDVQHLDGLIVTHAHFDHIAGLDDLRAIYLKSKSPIPCLLSKSTYDSLKVSYAYMFSETTPPKYTLTVLEEERGSVDFLGIPLRYTTYWQGSMPVNGFCIGNFAYISDIKEYSDSIFEDLKGIETLVVSALRFAASDLHLSIDEALAFSEKVGAKRTWITHVSHELDHEKLNAYLPPNVRMAYDGLKIEISNEN